MNLLPEIYSKLLDLVASIKEISIMFGKHTQIALRASDNMNLLSGLLPSKYDIPEFIKSKSSSSGDSSNKSSDNHAIMIGLDSSGKTAILYKYKLGEIVTTVPTIGFNVETVSLTNLQMTVWDVGGQDQIRPLWAHYYQNKNVIIFVVDSTDRDRLNLAKEELWKVLQEMPGVALVVMCNKQDLPTAMTVSEIKNGLDMYSLGYRPYEAFACSAPTGDGLEQAWNWISNNISVAL